MNKEIKTSIDKSKPPNKSKLFKIDSQKKYYLPYKKWLSMINIFLNQKTQNK